MKINKVIIILLTLTFLNIFSFIQISNVKGASYTLATFEPSGQYYDGSNQGSGASVGSGTYYSFTHYTNPANFMTSDTIAHTGSISLKMINNPSYGFLNFSDFNYDMTNITDYLRAKELWERYSFDNEFKGYCENGKRIGNFI